MDRLGLEPVHLDMALRLGLAWLAGAVIGLERSHHGRFAGFRTHALVSLASALLMMLTVFQARWWDLPDDLTRADPARMAQGVMTGVGFIGAGVIFKDGLTVRGLTTAASLWITAALGLLFGAGLYAGAAGGTVVVVATLAGLRFVEAVMPTERHARLRVRVALDSGLDETALRHLAAQAGFAASSIGCGRDSAGAEYHLAIVTTDAGAAERLTASLATVPGILAFNLTPSGDWD